MDHVLSVCKVALDTSQKPDIVIIDNQMKATHLYELTCPAERNIDTRNNEKSTKYAHFTTDTTHLSCKVNCCEVSTKGRKKWQISRSKDL